jgi:dihydrofolate reductase
MSVELALMAARSRNQCIGRDNQLPWRLPGDLQYFKRVTRGKPVIMGRRTWESLNRALPGRTNIVITRRPDYAAEGGEVVHSLDEALKLGEAVAARDNVGEVVVIGGADIFHRALERAGRVYMTEVHAHVDGDTFFPPMDSQRWHEVERDARTAEAGDDHDYSLVVYERSIRQD